MVVIINWFSVAQLLPGDGAIPLTGARPRWPTGNRRRRKARHRTERPPDIMISSGSGQENKNQFSDDSSYRS